MKVVSFDNFRPAPRYDGQQWTRVQIEESTAETGPWTVIDTLDLAPQADPTHPAEVDFTTELATLDQGWYLVTFLDASDDESAAAPVFNAATPQDERKPSVDDVALLLRTRTVKGTYTGLGADSGSAEITTFDEHTRPSRAEVQSLINTAYDAMLGRLGVVLIPSQYEAFSHVVALYTAVLIEISYFRESANQAQLDMWNQMIVDALAGITTATEREEPITQAQFGMGTLVVGTTMAANGGPPEPDYMPGIDW